MTTFDPLTSTYASNLICTACGTQHPTSDRSKLKTCHICDDPRQYVPPTGQSFTTLKDLTTSPENYHNVFTPLEADPRLISIHTIPKVAIGQRAILIRTASGKNILWDCVTYLDVATIARINNLGGLHAIVISHPHYYSTHAQWSEAFGGIPVYTAAEDKEWFAITSSHNEFLPESQTEFDIGTGVKAIKLGGHFPGSLVLLFASRLLIADTLVTTPSGVGRWEVDALGEKRERPEGLNTYSFMWSVPNFIPLNADEIAHMWSVLKNYDFRSTHGAFVGGDVEDECVKQRVLTSMQIQVQAMGWKDHEFLKQFTVISPRLNN